MQLIRSLNDAHLQEINLFHIRNPFLELAKVSFDQFDAVKHHQDFFLLSDIMNGVISFSFYFENLSKINQACITKPQLLSFTIDVLPLLGRMGWDTVKRVFISFHEFTQIDYKNFNYDIASMVLFLRSNLVPHKCIFIFHKICYLDFKY